ncbi:MAG: ABC transporter ATP-binding protein, partial [Proteobacteria bacterium]|nr:ABC transporter ATP-binding protein [Pseudomonadota bacterium]
MIRLHGVSSGYPNRSVLDKVDLHIGQGEFVGVLGPNGSGKTTLLRCITGLNPFQGNISLAGRSISELSPKNTARLAASVPQHFQDGLDMRVDSLVLMGRYPYLSPFGMYSDVDRSAAESAMDETDTRCFAHRRAGELSGGELQRVVLARAITQDTPILLLDEAASGLDMARKIEVFDLLSRKNTQGTTIVAVIHDLNLAALYCSRLVMLLGGAIKYDGSVSEVFTAETLADMYG